MDSKQLIEQAIRLVGMNLNPEEAREVINRIYEMGVLDGKVLALEARKADLQSALKAIA